jgi:hypothetical protein
VRVAHYLGLLHKAQLDLADPFRRVGQGHADEADVLHICEKLAKQCDAHAERLHPLAQRYGEGAPDEPDRLYSELFQGTRTGGLGLLRDLHDLYLLACEGDMAWTLVAGPRRLFASSVYSRWSMSARARPRSSSSGCARE